MTKSAQDLAARILRWLNIYGSINYMLTMLPRECFSPVTGLRSIYT